MLGGCEAKLRRVEQQLADYKTLIDSYRENCCGLARKDNVKTGEIVFKAVNVVNPPVVFSVIAGEILHNLRGPLDYLTCALIERSGGKPNRFNEFPICCKATEFQSVGIGKLAGVPTAHIAQIERLQPYNGRDRHQHPLRLLSVLNNLDKHKLVLELHNVQYAGRSHFDTSVLEVRRNSKSVALKNGTHIRTYGTIDGSDPRQCEVDIQIGTDVFFRYVTGRKVFFPIYQTLQAIRSYLHKYVFVQPGLADGFKWDGWRELDSLEPEVWLPGCV